MKQVNLIILLLLIQCVVFSQSYDDSLYVPVFPNSSTEVMVIHEVSNFQINAQIDGTPIQFNPYPIYFGIDESYLTKHLSGHSFGFNARLLYGGSDIINYSKFVLKGFRIGMKYGYRIKIWNRLKIEPNSSFEYGNLRVKDVITGDKLINGSLNLTGAIDLRIIPVLSFVNHSGLSIGASVAYLHKFSNKGWYASKGFDSNLTTSPINWSGWYVAIKVGVIEFK